MEQSALLTFGVAALVAGTAYGLAVMCNVIVQIAKRPGPEDLAADAAEAALLRQQQEDMGYDPALDTMLEEVMEIYSNSTLPNPERQRLVWATYRRRRIDHMARITRRTEVADLVLSLQGLISACELGERTPEQLRTVASSWIETANRQAIGGTPARFAFGIPADYFLTRDVYHGLLNDPSTPDDERQALMGYCVTEDDGYLLNLELIRTPRDLSRRLYNRVRIRQGLPALTPPTASTSIQRTVPNPASATAIVSIPPRRDRRRDVRGPTRLLTDMDALHIAMGPGINDGQPDQTIRQLAQEQVDSADGLVQIPPQMRQAHPIILLDENEEPPEYAQVGQLCYMASDDMWWCCTHWVDNTDPVNGDSRIAAWQPHTPSVLDRNHLTAQLGAERAQREANAARISVEHVAQPQGSAGLQITDAQGGLVFDSAQPNAAPDGAPVPFVYVRERDSLAAYQALGAGLQGQIWARILFNATGNVADMRDGAGMSWTENHQTNEYVLTYSLQGSRAHFQISVEGFYRQLHTAMNQHTRGDPMPVRPLIMGVPVVDAFPTMTAMAGDIVYMSGDSRLYRFNGSGWEPADTLSIGAEIQGGSIQAVEISADTITAPALTRDEIMAARRDGFGRPYVLCTDNQWRSQEGAHAFNLEQEAAEAIRIEKLARQRRGRRRDVQ